MIIRFLSFFSALSLVLSCGVARNDGVSVGSYCRYAGYFDITVSDTSSFIVTVSPDGRYCDTLEVCAPMDNIVCMSTSNVAALAAIGADSVITAVSGLRYISTPSLQERKVYDIGFDSFLDYERIIDLKPDVLVTYAVSGTEPQYVSKLRSLGVPVLVLHDHLETHPLARAEYIRLFGFLTGRQEIADSLFNLMECRYDSLRVKTSDPVKVLLNIPYGDAWYIPGEDSYMSQLVRDAGGVVLGAAPASAHSRVIDMETAFMLSWQADVWLNPGHCRTRNELGAFHQLFPSFGPLKDDLPIYNNTLRMSPEGGNDFWESGAVRPDLVLEDLVRIFNACKSDGPVAEDLDYFFALPVSDPDQ